MKKIVNLPRWLTRRAMVGTLALAAAVPLVQTTALADEWPSRPVEVIVGFGPGGGTDLVGRAIAASLDPTHQMLCLSWAIEQQSAVSSSRGQGIAARMRSTMSTEA